MKTIRLTLSAVLFAISTVTFTACESDPCDEISCNNNGTCIDGDCLCDDWYEGSNCNTEARTKFYGNFVGTLSGPGGTQTGGLNLLKYSGDIQRISMDDELYFELKSSTSFDVPNQPWTLDGEVYQAQGQGSISGDQLQFSLSLNDGVNVSLLSFSGTR
tara:strand:- start:100 stop:576 length:477 start_codon:yes stop_codon:yes gene_type:complete